MSDLVADCLHIGGAVFYGVVAGAVLAETSRWTPALLWPLVAPWTLCRDAVRKRARRRSLESRVPKATALR